MRIVLTVSILNLQNKYQVVENNGTHAAREEWGGSNQELRAVRGLGSAQLWWPPRTRVDSRGRTSLIAGRPTWGALPSLGDNSRAEREYLWRRIVEPILSHSYAGPMGRLS